MPSPHRTFDPADALALDPDPVRQWLDWEEQANLVGFRTSTAPVEVEVAVVPRSDVEIHVLPGAPDAIVERFVRANTVCIPRHPLNRDATVAWFDAPVAERWTARFTSSRTLALPGPESGDALFSLKLATDHPHPDFHQPEKTKLRDEARSAIDWAHTIRRIDALLGPIDHVQLVTEVLVVLAAGSETGYVVRDLRGFQDGAYYLPALSIPWVGRQIARAHGAAFDDFWGEVFAEPVGRAKARLLARYGLWYETPNPQNVLVKLAPDLRPTGTLVFRDIGDGYCATDAATARGVPWTRVVADLRPEAQNSFWAFGEAGDHSVPPATLETWYARHDAGYFGELAAWFPDLAPPASTPADARLAHWSRALTSEAAAAATLAAFSYRMQGRHLRTDGGGTSA
jgi:hypothetical protein